MRKNIPILLDHDYAKIIGMWDAQTGIVEFSLDEKMTLDKLYNIFGNVGFRVLVAVIEKGCVYITALEILEFSLVPTRR